jgi:hypothetical protein
VARPLAIGGIVALALAVLAGFVAHTTQPTYDSIYSLLWAREILDGGAPSFDAYRAPTQHPLALAISLPLVAAGAPPHAFDVLTLAAYVALVAGLVRLGAVTLGLVAGLIAGALLLTRLNFAFLAAFGYVDIPYLALLVWAGVRVARDAAAGTARNRPAVWLMLVAAGLLRPEGWAFAALYAAWVWRSADTRGRLQALLGVAAAPLLWALTDLVLMGEPLFSWTYTTGSAAEFGRTRSMLDLPRATVASAEEYVKAPVLALGAIGTGLALWRARRPAAVPLALTAGGIVTFLVVSAQGFSVIPRYFAAAAIGIFLFAGHALGGWEILARGSRVRHVWAAGAIVAAFAGIVYVATTLNPAKVQADLRLRERVFADLEVVLAAPAVRAARRCGPITVPNHKLAPYVRWRTGLGPREVVARSDHGARRSPDGVAIVVRDIPGIRSHPAFGPHGGLDAPTIIPPPDGFDFAVGTSALTAWVRCP